MKVGVNKFQIAALYEFRKINISKIESMTGYRNAHKARSMNWWRTLTQ